jgi:hypothetical protein
MSDTLLFSGMKRSTYRPVKVFALGPNGQRYKHHQLVSLENLSVEGVFTNDVFRELDQGPPVNAAQPVIELCDDYFS